jgi:hypothetical protein
VFEQSLFKQVIKKLPKKKKKKKRSKSGAKVLLEISNGRKKWLNWVAGLVFFFSVFQVWSPNYQYILEIKCNIFVTCQQ